VSQKSELVFSTAQTAQAIKRQAKSGKLRRVARGIYTSNLSDDLGMVLRRNAEDLIDHLFPGGVVSHRSAFEFGDRANRPEHLFLTLPKAPRIVRLPGMTIHVLHGPGPTDRDGRYREFFISSRERALLENLSRGRERAGVGKNLPRGELEKRLVDARGLETLDTYLNTVRDRARPEAEKLGLQKEFAELSDIIGAILGSGDADINLPSSEIHQVRSEPYDSGRLRLFESLAVALSVVDSPSWMTAPPLNRVQAVLANSTFYEAYFSNFIEGTKFDIDVAEGMVFRNMEPETRPQDQRDVRHTYALLSDLEEMRRVPASPEDLIEILKSRHKRIMSHRAENLPGEFKRLPNRAGETRFVDPELVEGTLRQAFRIYADRLATPLSRAIYMGVVIAEIHPFMDGNGRISRAMMNAELTFANQCRIIVPTGGRDDYLLALRAFSRQERAEPIIKVLAKCQALTSMVIWAPRGLSKAILRGLGTFEEPPDARLFVPETAMRSELQSAARVAESAGADLETRPWDPAVRAKACSDFSKAVVDYVELMPDFHRAREAAINGTTELIEGGIVELRPLVDRLNAKEQAARV
jgi:Fic/DOC family